MVTRGELRKRVKRALKNGLLRRLVERGEIEPVDLIDFETKIIHDYLMALSIPVLRYLLIKEVREGTVPAEPEWPLQAAARAAGIDPDSVVDWLQEVDADSPEFRRFVEAFEEEALRTIEFIEKYLPPSADAWDTEVDDIVREDLSSSGPGFRAMLRALGVVD